MRYNDDHGRRWFRPLTQRPPVHDGPIDDARVDYILEVIDAHPKWKPERVYTWIRIEARRHDISKDMVHAVMSRRSRRRG